MKHVKININHLDQYMLHIRGEASSPKTSLYEYVQANFAQFSINPDEKFLISIEDIDFAKEKNMIDLSEANLSGAILKNINFSGDNLIIKGANLIGCQIQGDTKFTDMISLDEVNFGPITLDRNIFVRADLEKAIYDPSNSQNMVLPLTNKQIAQYLDLPKPRINLNDYLTEKFAHIYPGRKIIADLSGYKIDERFSGADISGANLTDAIITGHIDRLIMRDCITYNTKFRDCTLSDSDFRGTALFDSSRITAATLSDVTFENAKFSVNERQVGFLIEAEDPTATQMQVSFLGETKYDPCYNKQEPDIKTKTITFSKADIQDFIANNTGDDFITFIKNRDSISGDIIADFSFQDLSGVDFSDLTFKNCDFSGAIINGCKFNNSIMENCNFSGAKASSSIVGYERPVAYRLGQAFRGLVGFATDKPIELHGAKFKNCNLSLADLTSASGNEVTFDNVVATGLNAPNITLGGGMESPSRIIHSDFRGANLGNLQGANLVIDKSDFTRANLKPAFAESIEEISTHLANDAISLAGKAVELKPYTVKKTHSVLSDAIITKSKFNHTDFEQADLSHAEFSQCSTDKKTNLVSANLRGANLSESKLHGKVRSSWQSWLTRHEKTSADKGTDFTNVDFQLDPLSGDIDTSKAIESISTHEAAKAAAQEKIDKNVKHIYNRYAKALIVGLVAVGIVGSMFFPPLLGALVPAVIALAATKVITGASVSIAFSMGTELISQNSVQDGSYSGFSIIRPIANLLGAKKIIDGLNEEHEKNKAFHEGQIKQLQKNAKDVERAQPKIIGTSKAIERLIAKGNSVEEARKQVVIQKKLRPDQHVHRLREARSESAIDRARKV